MNQIDTERRADGRIRSPDAAPEYNRDYSINEILATFWRRKLLFVLIVLAALFAGYNYMKSQVELYTASSQIMLNIDQQAGGDFSALFGGLSADWRVIESQQRLMVSEKLMGRVVDVLDLTKSPLYNPWLAPAKPRRNASVLLGWLPADWLPSGWPLPAWPSSGGWFGNADTKTEAPPPEKLREIAIRTLIGQIEVQQLGESLILAIRATTPDPEFSAKLADTVAEQYILNQIALKYEATESATVWLSQRVAELKEALENAETAVADFRVQNQLTDEDRSAALASRVVSLKETRRQVAEVRDVAKETLSQIQALMATDNFRKVADISKSTTLQSLAGHIAEAPDPSARAAAVARFRTELDAVVRRLQTEIANSENNLVRLASMIDDVEAKQADVAAARIKLGQLKREAEAARAIYETFLSKQKETSVAQGSQKADAVVIAQAWVPGARSHPQTWKVLLVSLIAGVALAAGVVVALEVTNQTFIEPEDLERFSGRSVIALVPPTRIVGRSALLEFLKSNPSSPFVEAVRNLRTSILLTGIDKTSKVVAFASAGEGEGKTTLSLALSYVTAMQRNQRVLLIDCDLRRRQLTRILGGHGVPGIIAYFSGSQSFDDIVHRPKEVQFDMIYADRSPRITADVFASDRFEELLHEARERYDLVILDTPPVLALTDIRIIAPQTDLVLFAAVWKKTRRRPIRAALRGLDMLGSGRLAMILNRADVRTSTGYYGSYYYRKSASRATSSAADETV